MASPETFAYTLVGVSYGEGNSSVNSVSTCWHFLNVRGMYFYK